MTTLNIRTLDLLSIGIQFSMPCPHCKGMISSTGAPKAYESCPLCGGYLPTCAWCQEAICRSSCPENTKGNPNCKGCTTDSSRFKPNFSFVKTLELPTLEES